MKSWKSRKHSFSDRNKDGCRYRRQRRIVPIRVPSTRSADSSYPLQRYYSVNAIVFVSLSKLHFRLVDSMRTLDDSTQFGCIGQPSLKRFFAILNIGVAHRGNVMKADLIVCLNCVTIGSWIATSRALNLFIRARLRRPAMCRYK